MNTIRHSAATIASGAYRTQISVKAGRCEATVPSYGRYAARAAASAPAVHRAAATATMPAVASSRPACGLAIATTPAASPAAAAAAAVTDRSCAAIAVRSGVQVGGDERPFGALGRRPRMVAIPVWERHRRAVPVTVAAGG